MAVTWTVPTYTYDEWLDALDDLQKEYGWDTMEAEIIEELIDVCDNYDDMINYLNDWTRFGGSTGAISSLIYHHQCNEWFMKWHNEIEELIEEWDYSVDDMLERGYPLVDGLAWFGWEVTASKILSDLESFKWFEEEDDK